jgi:hypothetical protein
MIPPVLAAAGTPSACNGTVPRSAPYLRRPFLFCGFIGSPWGDLAGSLTTIIGLHCAPGTIAIMSCVLSRGPKSVTLNPRWTEKKETMDGRPLPHEKTLIVS